MQERSDIKDLTHEELSEYIRELGSPRFRVKQIEEWLYAKGCTSFDEMTNLPKDLRGKLERDYAFFTPRELTKQISQDGTRKYLFELSDGASVEAVGIPSLDEKRLTVCFSTQAGCPIGCTFCATGKSGFVRNLTAGEIFDQVQLVGKDFKRRVTGVVGMGQGEPFLNYTNVVTAIRRMNSPLGLGIGARHITISTCGIIDGIEKYSNEDEQFTLAVSLHSAIQATRDSIMPGVKKFPLDKLRQSLADYSEKTGRRPSFEYAPMHGINDSDEDIAALVDYCRGMLCHVNLIPLNPVDATQAKLSNVMEPSLKLHAFEEALSEAHVEYSIRKSRGADIDGACGQLRQRIISVR